MNLFLPFDMVIYVDMEIILLILTQGYVYWF